MITYDMTENAKDCIISKWGNINGKKVIDECSKVAPFNGNSGKFTFAFAYSLKKCGAFGAVGGGIRCAFNIASAKNFSAFAKKRGAYAKM